MAKKKKTLEIRIKLIDTTIDDEENVIVEGEFLATVPKKIAKQIPMSPSHFEVAELRHSN